MNVTDNKTFWRTVKPLLCDKLAVSCDTILIQNDEIVIIIDIVVIIMLNNNCLARVVLNLKKSLHM